MYAFLANENVPYAAIQSARKAGFDITWIKEICPGFSDEAVLALSITENRVLMTFDKDFGELAFRLGKSASAGVILLRPRLRSPEFITRHFLNVLSQSIEWHGNFSVSNESQIRVIPLP
jgi:predicted nuclease of predicted toxin-antitoxin system